MKAFEYARGLYTDNVTSEIKTAVGKPDHPGSNLLWRDDDDETRGVYVDSDTLCYSTGFVDKNGKDIFTGDILAIPENKYSTNGRVVWLDEEGAFFIEGDTTNGIDYKVYEIFVHTRKIFTRLNQKTAKCHIIKEEPKNE